MMKKEKKTNAGFAREVASLRKQLVTLQDSDAESKGFQNALSKSDREHRLVTDNVPALIACVNTDTRYVLANRSYREWVGLPNDQLIGRHVREVVGEAIYQVIQPHVEQALSGQQTTFELEIPHKDGNRRWVSTTYVPNLKDDGTVEGFYALILDITERKQAEEALGTKTGQLQAIGEAMTKFLEEGNWRAASARLLCSALSQTQSEYGFIGVVVEGPVLRILAQEGIKWDTTVNREFYERALRTYQEVGYLEFTNLDNLFGRVITSGDVVLSNDPGADPRSGGLPPGHPPLRHFLGVPILRGSEVVGMVGVANRRGGYTGTEEDHIQILSQAAGVLYDSYRRMEREAMLEEERQRAQEELKQTYQRLREATLQLEATAEEERRRIARELHDEFGQALTCLKFDLAWLGKRFSKISATTQHSELLDKVRSMLALVSCTMKTVQHMCASLRPSILDDLGLAAALEWLMRDFQIRTGIQQCAVAISPEIPQMQMEPTRGLALFRSAQELLTNVMRHARASRVDISLREETGMLILQVSDNGRGITERELTSPTSMGLSGIRERASLLGGESVIRGQPGAGTTVTVRIPLG